MSSQHPMGLIAPAQGFVSTLPVMANDVPILPWAEIKEIARSNKLNGDIRFPASGKFARNQVRNNCANASPASSIDKLRYESGLGRIRLSQTWAYLHCNGGYDQGMILHDAMRFIADKGLCLDESCDRNTVFKRDVKNYAKCQAEAGRFRVHEVYTLPVMESRDVTQRQFWTALARGFQVCVAIQAGSNFNRLDSNGVSGVDRGSANHAVSATGLTMIDGKLIATGQNSWEGWGRPDSRMGLTWDHFDETIGVHSFYALRSIVDDPQGQNPPEAK